MEQEYKLIGRSQDVKDDAVKQRRIQKCKYVNESGVETGISPFEERIMGGGQFLQYNEATETWERTNKRVRDYYTLLRIFIVLKLYIQGGFYIRKFMSESGKCIYIVLYQQEINLRIQAQRIGLPKKIDISICDLLSLEPVDKRYRPLRLNLMLFNDDLQKGEMKQLATEIKQVLEEINYPQLIKSCGQTPLSVNRNLIDNDMVSISSWKSYLKYLKLVLEGHKQIKERFSKVNFRQNLTKMEIYELLKFQMKFNSFKTKSSKPYVKEQGMNMYQPEGINERNIKMLNMIKRAQAYKELFIEAQEKVNGYFGSAIQNIWDKSNFEFQGPYIDFFMANRFQNFNKVIRLNSIWGLNVINEDGRKEIFLRMERGILVKSIILGIMDTHSIRHQFEYTENDYRPQSQFDIFGESNKPMMKPLMLAAKKEHSLIFSYQSKQLLKNTFVKKFQHQQMANIIRSEDKEKALVKKSDKEKEKEKAKEKAKGGLDGIALLHKWVLNVPIRYIMMCYGQRIALYFKFLGYSIKQFFVMSILAVPAFMVTYYYERTSDEHQFGTLAFGIIVILWTCFFYGIWLKHEHIFQTQYGMTSPLQAQQQRPDFKGIPIRSLSTDNINESYYPIYKTWLKFSLGIFFIILIILVEFGIIIGILALTEYFEKDVQLPDIPFLNLSVLISVAVWIFIVIIFDYIFKPISIFLTKWENHKYQQVFENSYIIKVLFFSSFNRLIQPIMIAYFDGLFVGCINDYCYEHLENYMRASFFLYFIKMIIFDIILPFLRTMFIITFRLIRKINENKNYTESPYYNINNLLEIENDKENFTKYGVDLTIDAQIEIFLQFCVLATFGVPFPLVFPIALVANIFTLFITKMKLIRLVQQPTPFRMRTMGVFNQYMNLVCYLAIFSNSALLTFTHVDLYGRYESPEMVFLIICAGSFVIKHLIDQILTYPDEKLLDIQKRHENIERRIKSGLIY